MSFAPQGSEEFTVSSVGMSAPAPVAADPSVPWKHASQKLKELGGLSGISLVEELSEVTVAVGGRPHFKCDLSMDIDAMVIPPASPLFKHVSGVVPPIQFQASSTAGSKQLAKLAASMEMLSQLAGTSDTRALEEFVVDARSCHGVRSSVKGKKRVRVDDDGTRSAREEDTVCVVPPPVPTAPVEPPGDAPPVLRDGYASAAAVVSCRDGTPERQCAQSTMLSYKQRIISAQPSHTRLSDALGWCAGYLSGVVMGTPMRANGKPSPKVALFLATEAHAADVMRLVQELATFEKEPEGVKLTMEQLITDGFRESPCFHVVLAQSTVSREIVGMAFCYHAYSTWEGRVLYLEDLYITPSYRSQGIGSLLLNCLAKAAFVSGCARLVWQVLDWNTPAIRVYEELGAQCCKEWLTFRAYRECIASMANK